MNMVPNRPEFIRIAQSQLFADRNSAQRRERLPITRLSHVLRFLLLAGLVLVVLPLAGVSCLVVVIGNASGRGFQPETLVLFWVPLFLLGLYALLVLVFLLVYHQRRDIPIEAEAAIVVSKHQRSRLTLEFEDGSRKELSVEASEYEMYVHLGIGDGGVAFFQSSRLLDFDRVT
jgi:hypothetical protein